MPVKGYPLPTIVDPGVYKCVKVYYPDDPAYRRAVMGALSYIQNWFAWDRDHEHLGREAAAAYRIAYGLTALALENGEDCDCGEPPEPPEPEIIEKIIIKYLASGGDCEEEEGDECMAGNCGPTPPIKKENGKLYWWQCCEWVEIGDFSASQEEVPPDAEVDPDPAPEDLACRKASYFSEVFQTVADTAWATFPTTVWDFVASMRKAFPELELSKWKLYTTYQAATAVWVVNEALPWEQVLSTDMAQTIVCQWAKLLSTDSLKVTQAEFDAMKTAVKTVTAPPLEYFLAQLMDAIGTSGFTWLALNGAGVENANCDCPAPALVDPTDGWSGNTWSHFYDFTKGEKSWTPNGGNQPTEYIPGQGWVDWARDADGNVTTTITKDAVSGGVIRHVWVKVHVGTGFVYHGSGGLTFKSEQAEWLIAAIGGATVGQGGDLIYDGALASPYTQPGNGLYVRLTVNGNIAAPYEAQDPDSLRIIAFAIAGTGTDPFPS